MKRAVLVREKISGLVGMLTMRSIKVTQRGSTAYTKFAKDGSISLMNIPYIPDDANDRFLDAIEGYIDHEVSHALFTDGRLALDTLAGKKNQKTLTSLWNSIEDTFVERKMAETFAGSAANLNSVVDYLYHDYTDKMIAKGGKEAQGAVMIPAIRALAGQTLAQEYMQDKWHLVAPLIDKVGDYLREELPKISSTADSLRVTEETMRLLEEDFPPSGDGESDEESDGGSGEDTGDGEASDKKSDGKPNNSKKKDGDDKNDSEDSDDSGEDSESEEGENDGDDDGDSGDGEPGSDADDELGSEGSPSENDGEDKAAAIMNAMADDAGFDGAMEKMISKLSASEASDSHYLVYTTDYDEVSPLDAGEFNAHKVERLEERVDHLVAPLQKDLERAIAARSHAIWSSGHRSGRLNASALARLTTFNDDRAFRRKQEAVTNDVAVCVLIDCSGSMTRNNRIKTAAEAGYALASVLERIRVPTEVLGFTTGNDHASAVYAEERRTGLTYARCEALRIPILKDFHDRVNSTVKNRFGYLANSTIGFLSNNVDGECVMIAASRLAKRKEKRKILMVLSDGMPAAAGGEYGQLNWHLEETVRTIERSGMEVLGIGIQTSEPKRFYPKFVELNNVNDLPGTVIREVKRLLMQS